MPPMAIDFKLRFDRDEIAHWSARYGFPGDSVIESEIGSYARTHGHMRREHLIGIGYWKSPRATKRCQSNDDEFVRAVTATAFSTPNERLKIEVLTLLCGVEWPTASVVLHFCSPDPYPILDFRALWSLSVDVPKAYDFEFWWAYTLFSRRLADKTGVTMRVLDRALWQFSKQHEPTTLVSVVKTVGG